MPRTVLIADDSPEMRKALCRLFENEEHYELCAEASNGQEAIRLAVKYKPELIILDLAMPVMDGVQAARELKRLMPGVPLILFSQYADTANSIPNLPVDAVVSKTDSAGLLHHVRSLIPV